MDQDNPAKIVTTAAGVVGGSALFAPVAVPTLHGLAGIAVVGLGIFAVGSVVYKAAGSLKETIDTSKSKGDIRKVF
ncbi:MAG: hypothetical protein MI685_09380 [Chlorobiales bacterium]|nr:hypothetical protein [Chlorobiales bacterium]